ncbi:hypothetical protein [Agarivorans sp.]|uniref:hypothetical protein n=1 Tax=Agarivorans sp. TaxID=1872412 RepID=UPI003D04E694
MSYKFNFFKALMLVLVLSPWGAKAGIIVDKSFDPSNIVIGTYIDNSNGSADLFDDFSLNSDTTITDITFWGGYWSSGTIPTGEALRMRIEQANGPARGATVLDTVFDFTRSNTGFTHNNNGSSDIWAFAASDLNIDLAAGDYWLSFYMASSASQTSFIWQRSVSSAPIGVYSTSADYISDYGDYAFVLESNVQAAQVSEPASFMILLLACSGLLWRRKFS